jgi:hypothetical protein
LLEVSPLDTKRSKTTINDKYQSEARSQSYEATPHSYPSTRPGQKYIRETSYKAKNTKNWQMKVMGIDYNRRKKKSGMDQNPPQNSIDKWKSSQVCISLSW